MSEFFLSVVNMSISASWIVLAVLLLRILLKKAPKWITVLLWAVVAIRLICPFTIESKVSLIPSAQTVSPGIMMDTVPQIYTGIPAVNNSINPIIGETFAPDLGDSANPLQVWIPIASVVWVVGIFALTVYGTISYLRVKKKISTAVLLRDHIYQSEAVASPFVLGMIRPRIYLPFSITGAEMLHVIAHEEAHIRRRDHWWKPLGFAILALHWFNPLMWIAYVLLCRDIELACDERVVKDLSVEERADYSQALLHCSVGRRMIASCPLAFGEVGVKDRVKSVLSYKKPAFWILVVGILASVVLAVCFLTNPKPGSLGTLENLEFITLTDRTENTACVWVSDGFSYERVGAISEDLLQDLANIKTSKEEISLSRSEDRDKSHTIVLQSKKQTEASPNSYLEGLYIHFNSDFTAVWINNNVKPTLTYKVIEPQKAKEVYGYIASYNVREPAVQIPTVSTDATDLASLKAKFPEYFDLGTFKGLEVYIWQMAEGSYSCGVLPGVNRNYTKEEIWDLHQNPASLDEMRAIIDYYLEEGLAVKEDITLVPVTMPHSSHHYVIDDAYKSMLNLLFWADATRVYTAPLSFIMDEGIFDIDGDGTDEHCFLAHGPTSGIFTFSITAYENGKPEYFNIFTCPHTTLRFAITEDGHGILVRKDTNEETYLTMAIDDGNIVIFSDTQDIDYWGEQGLGSPFVANNTSAERSNNEVFSLEDFSNITVGKSKIAELYSIDPQCAGYQCAYGVVYEFPLDDGRYLRAICRGEIIQSLDFHDTPFWTGNTVIPGDPQYNYYWYEQGLNFPLDDSLWITIPEEGYFDSGPLKTIHGNFRTYYENSDGTYQYHGYIYKYRLVITGRMPNAVADTTYVYLSNMKDISFEQAMWASGLSSSLEAYFTPEEAVLVEITTETPSDQTPNIKITRNGFLRTYTVYDLEGNVLYRIESTNREAEIWEVSPGVYGLVTQTGTGRSTNWAVFCDVEKGLVSDTFHYVLDAQGPYVLCGMYEDQKHSVSLQNIFSPTEAEYRIPLDDASPNVADCIKAGTFTDENTVLITYCVGAVSPTPTEKSFPIAPNRNP